MKELDNIGRSNKIIFIGGVHGSGKGKVCETIKGETNLIHLTASEVLKWHELSTQEEKQVKNISETQNRLIINLNEIVQENKSYLLDGHYCLLNKYGSPEKVPIQTFIDINPIKLVLVIADPEIIKERLETRDSKKYKIKDIKDFQELEINFAEEVKQKLDVPLLIIDSQTYKANDLLDFLK